MIEKREEEEGEGKPVLCSALSWYMVATYIAQYSAYMLVVQSGNTFKSSAHCTTFLKCLSGRPIPTVVRGVAQLNGLSA